MELVVAAVSNLGVKSKLAPPNDSDHERIRLRVGGYDKRHEVFKGWIEVEPFTYQGAEGSFCVMQRDQVRGLVLYIYQDLKGIKLTC